MKKFVFVSIILTLLPGFLKKKHSFSPPPECHGFVLGLFSQDETFDYSPMLKELKTLGSNAVSFHIVWMQDDTTSVDIHPVEKRTVSDTALIRSIKAAHKNGLKVFLFPIVLLENRKPDEWRGTISPSNWDDWFAGYTRYIMHYIKIAKEENVEYFSIGSELCTTETLLPHWTYLIEKIRKVYRGKLSYTANWDYLDDVSFWDQLDEIGINAYYELSDSETPDISQLKNAWIPIIEDITGRFSKYKKPLFITEIGYFSMDKSAMDPWNYTAERHINMKSQNNSYEAFIESWGNVSMLKGIFIYNSWDEGGTLDGGYTPRGKPAEHLIKEWFTP